jgi:hypothetical protein
MYYSRCAAHTSFGLVAATIAVCNCGCVQLTQAEIKVLETRELDMPYAEAYEAAANAMFDLGFTIDHSDKESGVLSGKRCDPRTGAKVANTLLFGVIGLAATGERAEAVAFKLTDKEPSLTQLRMKVIVNGKSVTDRQLMTKIWTQVEREAMLESRPVTDEVERANGTEPPASQTSTESEAAPKQAPRSARR